MVRIRIVDAFGSVYRRTSCTTRCIAIALSDDQESVETSLRKAIEEAEMRNEHEEDRPNQPWTFSGDRQCRRCSHIFSLRQRSPFLDFLALIWGALVHLMDYWCHQPNRPRACSPRPSIPRAMGESPRRCLTLGQPPDLVIAPPNRIYRLKPPL